MPTKPTILVIDDDPSILDITAQILEEEGYQVEKAANGQEGLQTLFEVRPELVMLDMRMPVLDGWGVTKVMRSAGSTVPILLVTAAVDAKRWAEEIQADAYLSKPYDLNEMLALVKQLLEQDQA